MSVEKITQILRNYHKMSVNKREAYLRSFEEKMIYRTTKTENPETTPRMVRRILSNMKHG